MRTIKLEQKQIKIYEYEFEKIVSHMIIYTYYGNNFDAFYENR